MKTIIAAIIILVVVDIYSQSDWAYIGKEIGYDFYYKPNSVIRGSRTYVIVIGVPLKDMKDPFGNDVKYVTVNIIFYKSTIGLRALITDHKYYYKDNTFKDANMPNRDLNINYYTSLMKLYDMIK